MMEFGIRGYNTCAGKPTLPVGDHLYYRDRSCTEIWRTNIAGFQQLWFNIDAAQRAGLTISSQLLKLATAVRGKRS